MSSYSPSLRIELIDTGSQVGTWGQTTNQNLGTLLEAGVCGYTSVSVTSANQALTALNGAPDQSRNMSIALTTTTSAAFNVYAPPSPKTYIIYNASAHAATIFNSTVIGNTTAAGTGVTVPAGRTISVWSDGTNFRAQLDTLPSGTTGVTQVPGTNNTLLATTAFVQAARTATLEAVYPIGSIYTNATNATNPGTLLGFGTWVAFGAGRVMVGFDASDPLFDSAEETGGSKNAIAVAHDHTFSATTSSAGSHSHGVNDPGHSHSYNASNIGTPQVGLTGDGYASPSLQTGASGTGISIQSAGAHTHTVSGTTASTGSSGTNANLQPYITVYLWKRTA